MEPEFTVTDRTNDYILGPTELLFNIAHSQNLQKILTNASDQKSTDHPKKWRDLVFEEQLKSNVTLNQSKIQLPNIPQEEYLHHHIDLLKEMQSLQPDDISTFVETRIHWSLASWRDKSRKNLFKQGGNKPNHKNDLILSPCTLAQRRYCKLL